MYTYFYHLHQTLGPIPKIYFYLTYHLNVIFVFYAMSTLLIVNLHCILNYLLAWLYYHTLHLLSIICNFTTKKTINPYFLQILPLILAIHIPKVQSYAAYPLIPQLEQILKYVKMPISNYEYSIPSYWNRIYYHPIRSPKSETLL